MSVVSLSHIAPVANPIPRWVHILTVAWFMTSGVVMFQPAPFDLFFLVLFFLFFITGQLTVPRSFSVWTILGLFLLIQGTLISITLARDTGEALFYSSVTLYILMMWFMLACLTWRDGEAYAHAVLKGYFIAALGAAIVGILTQLQVMPGWEMFMDDPRWGRVKSTFKDPNVFGPFVVPAFIIAVENFFFREKHRLFFLTAMVILALGVVFTFSRGALGLLALSSGIYFILRTIAQRGLGRALKPIMMGIALFIIACGLIYATLMALDLLHILEERQGLQGYDANRFGTQWRAILLALQHPFGVGPGHAGPTLGQEPHNVYLFVLVENGFLAAIGFIIFLFSSLFRAAREMFRGPYGQPIQMLAFSVILGTMIESLVIDTLHWRHFFVFLALAWGRYGGDRQT